MNIPWVGNIAFCEEFPTLFQAARSQGKSVLCLASGQNEGAIVWELELRRSLRSNEEMELNSLLEKIRSVRLNPRLEDCRLWKEENSGHFSCKSFMQVLLTSDQVPAFDAARFIWETKVPTKVQVFGWLLAWGRLNVGEVLQHRMQYMSISPHWCVLCKGSGESIDHLFGQCPFSKNVWSILMQKMSVSCTLPQRVAEVFSHDFLVGESLKKKKVWGVAVLSVLWSLWLERNRRLFQDKELDFAWSRASQWLSCIKDFQAWPISDIIRDWTILF